MYLQYTLSSKINLSSKIPHNLRECIFLIFSFFLRFIFGCSEKSVLVDIYLSFGVLVVYRGGEGNCVEYVL